MTSINQYKTDIASLKKGKRTSTSQNKISNRQ